MRQLELCPKLRQRRSSSASLLLPAVFASAAPLGPVLAPALTTAVELIQDLAEYVQDHARPRTTVMTIAHASVVVSPAVAAQKSGDHRSDGLSGRVLLLPRRP